MKRKISILLAGLTLVAGLAVGCNENKEEITVYMPDGAPALALAKLMAEDTKEDGVTYNVVPASLIASKVTSEDSEKNADLCFHLNHLKRLIVIGKVIFEKEMRASARRLTRSESP